MPPSLDDIYFVLAAVGWLIAGAIVLGLLWFLCDRLARVIEEVDRWQHGRRRQRTIANLERATPRHNRLR